MDAWTCKCCGEPTMRFVWMFDRYELLCDRCWCWYQELVGVTTSWMKFWKPG